MAAAGGPDGESCSDIFDAENELNGAPSTTVLSGKRTTFSYGLSCPASVKSGDDLTIDVLVDVQEADAIFVGVAP
jgi:hypothetical protein